MFTALLQLQLCSQALDLSIIMCAYNAQTTVAASVYSIISQCHDNINFELVFVDDGSTDETVQQLGYTVNGSSVPVQLVQLQENKGLVQARKAGVEAARGELIIFVDADDFLMENVLESIVVEMRNSNVDLLHFVAILQGAGTTATAHWWNPNQVFSMTGQTALMRLARYQSGHSVWGKVFRRILLLKAYEIISAHAPNVIEMHTVYAEDYLLTMTYYLMIEKYQSSLVRGYIYMDVGQNSVQVWRENQPKSHKRLADTLRVAEALESIFRAVARLQYPEIHSSCQRTVTSAMLQHMSIFLCTPDEKALFQQATKADLLTHFAQTLAEVCDDPNKLAGAVRVLDREIRQ